ncbi:MAG: hypothetical protein WCK93_09150 [Nitrosomonadales bacterium]
MTENYQRALCKNLFGAALISADELAKPVIGTLRGATQAGSSSTVLNLT